MILVGSKSMFVVRFKDMILVFVQRRKLVQDKCDKLVHYALKDGT